MELFEYYETGAQEHGKTLDEFFEEAERSQRNLKSEDFDFPASLTFRQAVAERYEGEQFPLTREDKPQISESESKWTRQQWDYIQQLKTEIKYLENKFNEYLDKGKAKPKVKPLKAIEL